jgi:hypothetical protein
VLDADQPPLAVDVTPAERPELAEPQPRAERDVEQTGEEEIGLVPERIERRELD